MTLTKREGKEAVRLLSLLQTHLESAMESCILGAVADEGPERTETLLFSGKSKTHAVELRQDRLDWRKAEALMQRIESQ